MKHLIKKLLTPKQIRLLRKLRHPFLLDSRYASRLGAYVALDGLYGNGTIQGHGSTIRRLAHNVEKGLNRSDFEPGHSNRIYDQVKQILDEHSIDDGTACWAKEVLEDYDAAQQDIQILQEKYRSEYVRGDGNLGAEELLGHLRLRRSCREYADRQVEASSLNQIVEAALEAPSSCSRQALKVFAAMTPERTREILDCFTGFTCFSDPVPAALVFCVDLRPYFLPKEIFVPTLDVGLAATNAALMATSLDMSLTYLSWGARRDEQESRLRSILQLPDYYEIVVGATCGYPRYVPRRPERKRVAEALQIVD